jgi:tRNA threonylcarbamoyladenosine biosynthesis protein TsaE
LFHLDLYRLADAEELEFIGLRDLLDGAAVLLIEWPERGAGVLPGPDLVVRLERDGKGRRVALEAPTARGEAVLERLPQT